MARRRKSPMGRWIWITLGCLAVGAAAAYAIGNRSPGSLIESIRQERPVKQVDTGSGSELRAENRRLRAELEAKEREIADLRIQLLLVNEGSRTTDQ